MTFKDADSKLPVMCIGITSGIGRLIFGYIADLPKVNRIFLQQDCQGIFKMCIKPFISSKQY
ncbi:monocarboxylate transporter 10-like [Monomorium pharaonis]|uniref:monocarboxylate transporter 10-like n=1 Tax=Monomorium pharaonis TaxID=307658 RepID=UPI001747AC1F|nr:monocarboxylate transporter 10-like [Monomorium pharaonis]